MTQSEILQLAVEQGIIDMSCIQQDVEMLEKTKFLNMHTYKIWNSNGFWYTYLTDENGRRLVKKKKKNDLDNEIISFYKAKVEEPTIEEIFDDWLEEKKLDRIQPQTIERYVCDYNRFIKGSSIDIKVKYFTEELLENYIRNTIFEFQLTMKAWSNLRTLLKGILSYAKKHKYTEISPTYFFGDLNISQNAFRKAEKLDEDQVFLDEEVMLISKTILEGNYGLSGLAIILSFYTGLRAGELSALAWENVKEDRIEVRTTEVRYRNKETGEYIYEIKDSPKTAAGKRDVFLPPEAIQILRILASKREGPYVFMYHGERTHAPVFTNKLRRICERINIVPRSLHKCRKTYASILHDAQVPDTVIQSQMGHASIDTTRKYYVFNRHSNVEEKREVLKAFDRR